MPITETYDFLYEKLSAKKQFTTSEIIKVLSIKHPDITDSALSVKINQLKSKKLIHQISRGLYTFRYKPDFDYDISLKTKRYYNRFKTLINSEIFVWDTSTLYGLNEKEIEKEYIFLYVDKNDIDDAFNSLMSLSKPIFLNPDEFTIDRYIIPQKEAILLYPTISQTPIIVQNEYSIVSIEAIIVDILIKNNGLIKKMGIDVSKIIKNALQNFNINQNKMLRYASRREKRIEIEHLIDAFTK
jgi:hypothetical protein